MNNALHQTIRFVGKCALELITFLWTMVLAFVFVHLAAACTKLLCGALFGIELRRDDYFVLVSIWMPCFAALYLLRFPWPGRFDSLRIAICVVLAIPLYVAAALIVGGLPAYAYYLAVR